MNDTRDKVGKPDAPVGLRPVLDRSGSWPIWIDAGLLGSLVLLCLKLSLGYSQTNVPAAGSKLPGGADKWELVWNEEFDYPDTQLEVAWKSQNGSSGHILSSRWRENAVVSKGLLRLLARKEKRGGQDWTAGNIWTRQMYQYGYFECRYRYAAAEGLNNSFNGTEIRRVKNEFCFSPAAVWLSLAVIPWGGIIAGAIDGTAMEVDYVRIYRKKSGV